MLWTKPPPAAATSLPAGDCKMFQALAASVSPPASSAGSSSSSAMARITGEWVGIELASGGEANAESAREGEGCLRL